VQRLRWRFKRLPLELQTVKQLLDSATHVVKKVRELLRQASYKRSLSKDDNEE
jgi:hypothetical protein